MSEKNDFLKRVLKVQKGLKAPKGQFNRFGGYKYRSAEDILEAAKPLNAENGIVLTVSDEIVLISDRFYVKATARLFDTESDRDISVTAYAREPLQKKGMDESQITGTASSYARKYALNGLYNIDDNKDPDTEEYHQTQNRQPDRRPQQRNQTQQANYRKPPGTSANHPAYRQSYPQQDMTPPAKPSQTEMKALIDLAHSKGQGEAMILKAARIGSMDQMTMQQYMGIFSRLQKIPDVQQSHLEL